MYDNPIINSPYSQGPNSLHSVHPNFVVYKEKGKSEKNPILVMRVEPLKKIQLPLGVKIWNLNTKEFIIVSESVFANVEQQKN